MPNKSKVVSDNDRSVWQTPLTAAGVRLGEPDLTVEPHEAGCAWKGPEWQHRGVCSPFWRLYYNFEPGGVVRSGGREWKLEPAAVLLVPEGVTFDCMATGRFRHLWIHFTVRPMLSATVTIVEVDAALREMVTALARGLEGHRAGARTLRRWAMAVVHGVLAATALTAAPAHPRLRLVLARVEADLAGALDNTTLAATAGLSVEAFIRWFRRETGRTPAVFVAEQRVREACRRLAFTGDSIEQVAEEVGFTNRHHFSRVFKRYAGCGPAAFRYSGNLR